jgi:multisubunit Na+/H+ antiporter MnhG subunit
VIAAALLAWRAVEVLAVLGILVLAPVGFCLLIGAPDDIDEEDQ